MPLDRCEQMRERRRRWRSAASLLIVALLAGCGGKGASSTRSVAFDATGGIGHWTPADAFKQEVERMCKEGTVQLHLNVHPKGKTPADIAEVGLINQKIERKVVSELEQVKPPAQYASAMTSIIGYRRSLADQLSTFAVVVRREEKAKFPALAKSKARLRVQLAQVAEKAKLKECAKVG